ncbi:hypothetical protein Rsub_03238 [Raphidocelis subcapitata]|uniref:protein disulfide-isomerase n=1 Tax=Raphidocelis subcapitata TaxID=307507 RepID=A0A2V0NSQ7_9CHLO|nr:hypothetical protein Rsub_03238 [Raphidocelis subcapitata]|eukprot:GBF90666.1 hypothetical protein Rsub_03238 [Raphidocelis subcapitata]
MGQRHCGAARRRAQLPLFAGALLLLLRGAIAGLYPPADGVVAIESPEDFKAAFLTAHGAGLVEFCIHKNPVCVALAPELRKVASNLQGIATVAAVDCGTASAAPLCEAHVKGNRYPTHLIVGPDLETHPDTGEPSKQITEWTGDRGAKAIAAAVAEQLNERHITALGSEAELDAFVAPAPEEAAASEAGGAAAASAAAAAAQPLARALLFTDKPKTTTLAKGLSTAYAGRLLFGQVQRDGGAGEAAGKLGVTEFPTLLAVKPDGSREPYSGPLKAPAIREFLDRFALPPPPGAGGSSSHSSGSGSQGKGKGKHADPYAAFKEVFIEDLAPANLTALDKDASMWLLAVYEGSEAAPCADELAKFDAAASAAQSIVRYGRLDASGADEEQRGALKAMGVDAAALAAAPCALQVVLLPAGAGKEEAGGYKRWDGGLDDPKALRGWLLEEVPDTTAQLGSEAELRAFLSVPVPAAGAPPDGRVVLFASKSDVPGVFKALAFNTAAVAGARIEFGWIPGSAPAEFRESAAKTLHVARTPALVAVVPARGATAAAAAKEGAPPGATPMAIQPYPGPLKYAVMALWLRSLAASTGLADEAGAAARRAAAEAAAAVRVAATQEELEAGCYSRGALCVLAMLDGRRGGERLEAWLGALREAAAKQEAKQPGLVPFAAVDASRQPAAREALRLRADELPALAVVSVKRMRYALGPPGAGVTAAAVEELLDGVLSGRLGTAPLQELPRLSEPTEPPGEDGPEAGAASDGGGGAGADEEFDLSEIMAEDVGMASKEEQLRRAEEEIAAEAAAKAKAKAEAEARAAAEAAAAAAAAKKKKAKRKKKKAAAAANDKKDEL